MVNPLVLIPFFVYVTMAEQPALRDGGPLGALALALATALAAGPLAAWGWWLARQPPRRLHDGWWRMRMAARAAGFAVVLAHAAAAFGLGYAGWARAVAGPTVTWGAELPALLLGVLPPVLGLALVQAALYLPERAYRGAALLWDFEAGRPAHLPPPFGRYLGDALRLRLLLPAAPIALVYLVRDASTIAARALDADARWSGDVTTFGAFALVVALAPVLVRNVLRTTPLRAGPLRATLASAGRVASGGRRLGDLLLWRTSGTMVNAAVVGALPWPRCVLLSDALVEALDEAQLQAVVAHEAGHLRHRHLAWFAGLVATYVLLLAGPATLVADALYAQGYGGRTAELLTAGPATLLFLSCLGRLARLFELQADATAAQACQRLADAGVLGEPAEICVAPLPPVGRVGANVTVSALSAVASMNGLPQTAPGAWADGWRDRAATAFASMAYFLHPPMWRRIAHLEALADDDRATARLHARVNRAKLLLATALGACAGCVAWLAREGRL